MKTIVVPVDFSEYSEFALETAAMLAKKHGAKIFTLHLLKEDENSTTQSSSSQQEHSIFLLKLTEQKFEKLLDKDYLEGIEVVPVIKHNRIFSEVNTYAESEDADLIVMGSHGVSGIKDYFLGSNTEKVVRHATVPLLIVKSKPKKIDFKDIVLATDFSTESVLSFKKVLKRLDIFDAKKHLLYINLPDKHFKTTTEMNTMANKFLMEVEGNTERIKDVNFVSDKSIRKGIINFSKNIDADLIAVITHGRTGLSHFFAGSISEDVGNRSKIPVITFRM